MIWKPHDQVKCIGLEGRGNILCNIFAEQMSLDVRKHASAFGIPHIFSSPEPRAHKVSLLGGSRAVVRLCVRPWVCQHFKTLISMTPVGESQSNFIWNGGWNDALGFIADRLSTLVSMATESSYKMSRIVRKPAFCICENKDADRRLCFCYMYSAIPLLPKSEISSL